MTRPINRGKALPARTASPTLKAVFDIADERGHSIAAACRKIGRSNALANAWKHGRSAPSILAVEELAGALGIEIIVKEKQP